MNKIKKIYFCPNCHCKIIAPKTILQINISGNININCGNCNKDGNNKSGIIKIKGSKEEN